MQPERRHDGISRSGPRFVSQVTRLFVPTAVGTALAFFVLLFLPWKKNAEQVIEPFLKLRLPSTTTAQLIVVLLSLLAIALVTKFPRKLGHSLRLGLIMGLGWIWAPSVTSFWIAYQFHRPLLACGVLALALVVITAVNLIGRYPGSTEPAGQSMLDPDLPVPEGGEDLLGRRDLIESLVSTILLEPPPIIAVTGKYGDGKTSFLNLAIGELSRSQEMQVPIIVRFSPWMAGDSNALVLSLLNSIVAGVKRKLLVPGLSGDAARYARTLLSAVPWTERLKDLVGEPSQEGRIDALVNRIARVRRRVLVVLDDLDRMEAKELDTVLKVLRGSDKLSNITFLCALDKDEVALILKKTRPHQETNVFIEKFFPVEFRLPEIDSAQLQSFFSQRIERVLDQNALQPSGLSKSLEKLWDGGADAYFLNLRKIKLFFNKVTRSLGPIAHEVNIEDFIRLQLVRDVAPSLYDQIYRKHEYFWNRDLAFEAGFKGPSPLDEERAKKERVAEYKKMEASVPAEKQYVLLLVESMFPHFAAYRGKRAAEGLSPVEAEKNRRIFHPRSFRQYFLSKIPSELFPQKEFEKFLASVKKMNEEDAAEKFAETFQSMANEDFKRWHFMHLIENRFEEFELQVALGLCRGMARKSALWPTDAFELMIAIRSTRDTPKKIGDSAARREFLSAIVGESASGLYTLVLVRRLEESLKADPSTLAEEEQFKVVGLRSKSRCQREPNVRIGGD